MKFLSLLIKPASSLCNLNCLYCFYEDVSSKRIQSSYGIMKKEIMEKLIDRVFDAVNEDGMVVFAFQGGEPMLAGLSYYREFVTYVNESKGNRTIRYALQTNGTLLNDEWGMFFQENQFLIGVSLDGYESNTNEFRVDAHGKGMYGDIMSGIDVLKRYGVEFNILAVITQKLSKHAKAFYSFLKSQTFSYVQCIPCLGKLHCETEHQLRPDGYVRFYKTLYDLWLEDYKRGEYMSISLFDNILLMLTDRMPNQCGMLGSCNMQFVVEADGSVYPCDFYVLDEYCCGNVLENSVQEIGNSVAWKYFFEQKNKTGKCCKDCLFWGICRGGCKRQQGSYLQEDRCAYREFLEYAYPTMRRIAQTI
ncbi:MAG: SPASM domain-containing protein [Clostridiales bacterium]|nr:SPASM domain-containing protein [Clostridiales bacterium]